MSERELEISEIGRIGEQNPYQPFLIAKLLGIIREPVEPVVPSEPPGLLLSRLEMPNPKTGGIVASGDGHWAAYDLLAAHFEGKRLRVLPAEKSCVTHEGKIVDEGVVIIERDDGILRVPGAVVDVQLRPWTVHKYGSRISVGQLAARHVFIPSPWPDDYEAKDIDPENGMVAVPRQRFY